MGRDRNILKCLWRRWDTRLCLLVVAAYCLAAGYGEAVYQAACAADRTPAYNQVREEYRYVPPAFVRLLRDEAPVPTLWTKASTRPPVWRQISSPSGK